MISLLEKIKLNQISLVLNQNNLALNKINLANGFKP